jgi:hypothetical protein
MPLIADLGFGVVRQETGFHLERNHWNTLLEEFRESPLALLWLADAPTYNDTIDVARAGAASGIPAIISIKNEPDIAWQDMEDLSHDPGRCRALVLDCYHAIREVNPTVTIIAGGISGPHDRGLSYLAGMEPLTWPADIGVDFHRYIARPYPAGLPYLKPTLATAHTNPTGGRFKSRQEELSALKALTGNRSLYLTEVGFTNGRQQWFSWNESTTAGFLLEELLYWHHAGVEAAVLYQLGDGPTTSEIDGYGMLRSGGEWLPNWSAYEKPAVRITRGWDCLTAT